MNQRQCERVLTGLLRFLGVLLLLAVFAVVMPTSWMVAANDWLGLAPLAPTPLVEYLTRSMSAIYAAIGALILYVSRDVRRYADFLVFIGKVTVLLGVFFTVIDRWAGLPAGWTWSEGPPAVVIGFGMVWLARRAGDGAG